MNLILVAVKDNALQAYQSVFNVRAEGEAIRNFQDALNDPNGRLQKHADDYDLYVLGTWDDTTGKITPEEPRQIARGKQLLINQGISITTR